MTQPVQTQEAATPQEQAAPKRKVIEINTDAEVVPDLKSPKKKPRIYSAAFRLDLRSKAKDLGRLTYEEEVVGLLIRSSRLFAKREEDGMITTRTQEVGMTSRLS